MAQQPITFKYDGKEVKFRNIGESYLSHFRKGQFYENALLEHIRALDLEGIYLDIGCNRGNHLVFFAMFTPATKVIGFEPLPHYAEKIIDVIQDNLLGDIAEVVEIAVADFTGPLNLSFMNKTYDVEACKIDDFNLTDVSVMKIDIEGMEIPAIKGARDTIERCSPRIYAEALTKKDFSAIEALLAEQGYRFTGHVFNASPTYEFKRET
tara:strand:+ start:1080 stop:1706 length:627 start_codon:yes stop_codon:yes gene_type:complete